MALIKCPECGRDISDKANACVHCGYPLSKAADNAEKKESNKELTQTVESQETLLPNKAKKTVSNKTKVIIAGNSNLIFRPHTSVNVFTI